MKYVTVIVFILYTGSLFSMYPSDKPGGSKESYVVHKYRQTIVRPPGTNKTDTTVIKYTSYIYEMYKDENNAIVCKGPVKVVISTIQ